MCAEPLVRANTCAGGICSYSDPYAHVGNRIWTYHDPDFEINPYATVDITAIVPFGYTFSVTCVNDDPSLPQNCGGNPVFSSANVIDGSAVVFKFVRTNDIRRRRTAGR